MPRQQAAAVSRLWPKQVLKESARVLCGVEQYANLAVLV
jgi:hypothetical protein